MPWIYEDIVEEQSLLKLWTNLDGEFDIGDEASCGYLYTDLLYRHGDRHIRGTYLFIRAPLIKATFIYEAAAFLIDELWDLLYRREQAHHVHALKISTDSQCVVLLYLLGDDANMDVLRIANVLKEFSNSRLVNVGFSTLHASPVIRTV